MDLVPSATHANTGEIMPRETKDTLTRRLAAVESLRYLEKILPVGIESILTFYGELLDQRKKLGGAENDFREVLSAYSEERAATLLDSWRKRGVQYCSYGKHLAPKNSVRIVAIRHWTRKDDTDEMSATFDSMHRMCAGCRQSLQTSLHAVKLPGNSQSVKPRHAQTIVKFRKVWNKISTQNEFHDWNKPNPLLKIPSRVPEDFEKFITEEDNIPPALYYMSSRNYEPQMLRIGDCEPVDFKALTEFIESR